MNKNILEKNKKRKILINSKGGIIGLASLIGVMMIITFLTLII